MIVQGNEIKCGPGYITLADFHFLYNQNLKLQANFKKTSILTYKTLHFGNSKQNFNLALAIFHVTTIAACKCYWPERQDMSTIHTLVNKCTRSALYQMP